MKKSNFEVPLKVYKVLTNQISKEKLNTARYMRIVKEVNDLIVEGIDPREFLIKEANKRILWFDVIIKILKCKANISRLSEHEYFKGKNKNEIHSVISNLEGLKGLTIIDDEELFSLWMSNSTTFNDINEFMISNWIDFDALRKVLNSYVSNSKNKNIEASFKTRKQELNQVKLTIAKMKEKEVRKNIYILTREYKYDLNKTAEELGIAYSTAREKFLNYIFNEASLEQKKDYEAYKQSLKKEKKRKTSFTKRHEAEIKDVIQKLNESLNYVTEEKYLFFSKVKISEFKKRKNYLKEAMPKALEDYNKKRKEILEINKVYNLERNTLVARKLIKGEIDVIDFFSMTALMPSGFKDEVVNTLSETEFNELSKILALYSVPDKSMFNLSEFLTTSFNLKFEDNYITIENEVFEFVYDTFIKNEIPTTPKIFLQGVRKHIENQRSYKM